jgi:pilus assembly protein TadC
MITFTDLLSLTIPGVFFAFGLRMLRSAGQRQDRDVLEDLKNSTQLAVRQVGSLKADLPRASFFSPLLLLTMLLLVSMNLFAAQPTIGRLFITLVIGFAIGVLVKESSLRRSIEKKKKGIDYFLPIVMERIVMAVESGLDIVPAIEAVVALKNDSSENSDLVSETLAKIPRYTDSGLGFLEAIDLLNKEIEAPSLKHALVHLGIAYREGGEIIHPLRELSDATQLYFQESVEEEIAKMPIKATVPLLCTFAGLIISFLTTPLIQVISITTKAMPR